MRLIDSDLDVYPYVETWACSCSEYGRQSVMAVDDVSSLPEIDPETLPIVKELREQIEQVKAERDVAVRDMEALMWYSGEGCHICAHSVEVHREPYVRLDCKLGGNCECAPKWKGINREE